MTTTANPEPCRIGRCTAPARWVWTLTGHPNSPPVVKAAYCHEHAENRARLLWDESPKPYTTMMQGPFEQVTAKQLEVRQ